MNFKPRKLAAGTAIACLTLFSVVTGCKKSSSGSGTNCSASISGTAFHANAVIGLHTIYSETTEITGFQINGKDSAVLQFWIPDSLAINKVYLAGSTGVVGLDVAYYPKTSTPSTYYDVSTSFGGHGSMTITARDTTGHTIAGTFSGVLYNAPSDSVVVSNAQFSVKYLQM